MIWEYNLTQETEQQSLSHEAIDGRNEKKAFSTLKIFILLCLFNIPLIRFPNLLEIISFLLKNVFTAFIILFLLLLFVQKLRWPSRSKDFVHTVSGFCKITAQDGWFCMEKIFSDGRNQQFFMPFHAMVHLAGVDQGILIEFASQQFRFIHANAFTDISMEESLAFLKKEQDLYAYAPVETASCMPSFLEKLNAADISVISASYLLSEDQVRLSFSECYRALPWHISYWKAFRKFYLYFVLYFALSFFFRSWPLAAIGSLLFASAVLYLFFIPSHKVGKDKSLHLAQLCGPVHVELCLEGIRLTASDSSVYLPYEQFFDVYNLSSCLCLLHTPQTFRFIPKTAFSSKEEEDLFYHTLQNKIREAKRHKTSGK